MPRAERVTTPLETALAHLDEEITQLRAEQQAFEQFADRVAALTVVPSQPATHPTVTSLTDGPASATTRTICAAYRETVMALTHYDDVYSDSLAESLAHECGPDIGTVLTEEMPVTTLIQQQVWTAAMQAAGERAALLETLAAERAALETARDTLTTLGHQAASRTDEAATPDETASLPSLDTSKRAVSRWQPIASTNSKPAHWPPTAMATTSRPTSIRTPTGRIRSWQLWLASATSSARTDAAMSDEPQERNSHRTVRGIDRESGHALGRAVDEIEMEPQPTSGQGDGASISPRDVARCTAGRRSHHYGE